MSFVTALIVTLRSLLLELKKAQHRKELCSDKSLELRQERANISRRYNYDRIRNILDKELNTNYDITENGEECLQLIETYADEIESTYYDYIEACKAVKAYEETAYEAARNECSRIEKKIEEVKAELKSLLSNHQDKYYPYE